MKKIISSILVFTLIAVPASGAFAAEKHSNVIALTDEKTQQGSLTIPNAEIDSEIVPSISEKQQNVPADKKTENKEKMSTIKKILITLGGIAAVVGIGYAAHECFSIENVDIYSKNFENMVKSCDKENIDPLYKSSFLTKKTIEKAADDFISCVKSNSSRKEFKMFQKDFPKKEIVLDIYKQAKRRGMSVLDDGQDIFEACTGEAGKKFAQKIVKKKVGLSELSRAPDDILHCMKSNLPDEKFKFFEELINKDAARDTFINENVCHLIKKGVTVINDQNEPVRCIENING